MLADLLPDFASLWLRDLHNAAVMFSEQSDTEALYRLGHTIKGSFLQFGFDQLANIGREIMACAKETDWEGAQERVKLLEQILLDLQQRLSSKAPK